MRNNWSQKETLLAFALYFSIADKNAEIRENNPRVKALADLIGRSPNAVKAKLWNIASLDPNQLMDGKAGLANAARMISELWETYQSDQMTFVKESTSLLQKEQTAQEPAYVHEVIAFPSGRDVVSESWQRIGQQYFRSTLFDNYSGRCCVTGIDLKKLLVASHIKPWKEAEDKTEKLNPRNGLLLNALHDKAFDKGLITLDKDLRIRVSSVVPPTPQNQKYLLSLEGKKIELPRIAPPAAEFIEYHNEHIFIRKR